MNHGILDVNQSDSKGFTPLFVAAQNGQRGRCQPGRTERAHSAMVRVLLSHPAIDIDYKDLSGVTALWVACQNNNSEVVELLLHPRNVVVEMHTDNRGHTRVKSLTTKKPMFDMNVLNGLDGGVPPFWCRDLQRSSALLV